LWIAPYRNLAPNPLPIRQFQAVTFINPAKDTKELSLTLQLDPGQTGVLRFDDPAGARLTGVRWKADPYDAWSDPLPGAELRVTGLAPGRARWRWLRHEQRKLAALVEVKADSPNPLTVVLRPWATVTGRLLGKDGKPLAFHRLLGAPEQARSDAAGKFRL